MKIFCFVVVLPVLCACAGSPVRIVNAPDARRIEISGESVVVSKDGSAWAAAFADYGTKMIYVDPPGLLKRKLILRAAIEQASGCKVDESTIDTMGMTMHASTRC